MVRDPLQQSGNTVIIKTECSGRGHQPHATSPQRGKFLVQDAGVIWLAESVASEDGVLLNQDHITAGLRGTMRRRASCRAAADDEQITVAMSVFIAIRIRFPGSRAHPGGFADELFIPHPHSCATSPFKRRQAHESLVIKPCGKESTEKAVYGAKIKTDTGPGVLPPGDKPFVKRLGGGSDIRVLLCTLTDRDQRSGFLDAG